MTKDHDFVLYVEKLSPTTAVGHCPCGKDFEVDAVTEQHLVYDHEVRALRAVCPRCNRIEPVDLLWQMPRPESLDANNRKSRMRQMGL